MEVDSELKVLTKEPRISEIEIVMIIKNTPETRFETPFFKTETFF